MKLKYKDLIKLFQPYAEEEVSIVADYGEVCFFPVSDGNIEIVCLLQGGQEPFIAKLFKEK
jgi:hypothetical protein